MPDYPSEPRSAPAPVLRVGFAGSIGRSCFSDLLLRGGPGLEPAYGAGSRRGLLAAVAAGQLDVAVYPGPAAVGVETALLCQDHLVVAMGRAHPLALRPWADVDMLRRAGAILLPEDGDEGEFRRLVGRLLPGLGRVQDVPARDLARRLNGGEAAALVTAGQADEVGCDVVLPLSGPHAGFDVRIAWSPAARDTDFGRVITALGA